MRSAERSYRLLLRCFPPAFRTQFGDELLGALLELAERGAVTQQVAEGIGLLVAGLTLRCRGWATGTARLWSAGVAAAGTVSLLLLAAVGLVVDARWLLALAGLATSGSALLSPPDSPRAGAAALAAAGWVLAAGLAFARRAPAATALAAGATALSGVVLAALAAAGRPLPALDLCGALAGLGLLAMITLVRRPAALEPAGSRATRWLWTGRLATASAMAGLAASGRLGAPGPWLSIGPATGARTCELTGVIVVGWLLGAVLALAVVRRRAQVLAGVAAFGLVPVLAAAGYVLNSAALARTPLGALIVARGVQVAAAAGLFVLVQSVVLRSARVGWSRQLRAGAGSTPPSLAGQG